MTVDRPTIVIVGPCASGKSTLARNLTRHGYTVTVSGQEHSEIVWLWRRAEADVMIALHIDLATLRSRRGSTWPEALYATQLRRLSQAYAAADLDLDTAALSESEALDAALRHLETVSSPRSVRPGG